MPGEGVVTFGVARGTSLERQPRRHLRIGRRLGRDEALNKFGLSLSLILIGLEGDMTRNVVVIAALLLGLGVGPAGNPSRAIAKANRGSVPTMAFEERASRVLRCGLTLKDDEPGRWSAAQKTCVAAPSGICSPPPWI